MALTKRGQDAAALLDNPNVRIMLDLIGAAEGAKHEYQTAFGGGVIEDLSDHPRTRHRFRETTGKRNFTTAAGRYQFLESTWDDLAKRLGLEDFGGEAQDLAAIELLRRAGALDAVLEGDFDTAVQKSGKTWASLPSSTYDQPTRSQDWVDRFMAERELGAHTASPVPESGLRTVLPAAPQAPGASLIAALGPTPALPQDFDAGMVALANTPPDAVPSWLGDVQSILSAGLPAESLATAPSTEPWEDQLIQDSLNDEAEDARSRAISTFFGSQHSPQVPLPRAIERFVNSLIARI